MGTNKLIQRGQRFIFPHVCCCHTPTWSINACANRTVLPPLPAHPGLGLQAQQQLCCQQGWGGMRSQLYWNQEADRSLSKCHLLCTFWGKFETMKLNSTNLHIHTRFTKHHPVSTSRTNLHSSFETGSDSPCACSWFTLTLEPVLPNTAIKQMCSLSALPTATAATGTRCIWRYPGAQG